MGKETSIEYADSTCNSMMGCNGCELLNPAKGIFICYAYVLTQKYQGQKGWPKSFFEPQYFPGRMIQAAAWPDLTGTNRVFKPWMNGLPRVIFMNDMGDAWTKDMAIDWMLADLAVMEACPHVLLTLTKQGRRMLSFFIDYAKRLPVNFWPGVSLTSEKTTQRLQALRHLHAAFGKRNYWISYEPVTGDGIEQIRPLLGDVLQWVVIGGESDQENLGGKLDLDLCRRLIDLCMAKNVKVFVKQLGSDWSRENGATDSKGGNMSEWPKDLQIRQMPPALLSQASLF